MKLWIHGLAAAVVSAVGDSGTAFLGAFLVAPDLVHNPAFWKALGGMLLWSAIKTVFAYMKQSPLP